MSVITLKFVRNHWDIDDIVEISRCHHSESIYQENPFDRRHFTEVVSQALVEPHRCVAMLALSEDRPIGYIYGELIRSIHTDDQVGKVQSWYVLPEYRGSSAAIKLIHAFKHWLTSCRVSQLSVSVDSGIRMEQTDRFLKRLGFESTGGNYCLN